MGCNLECKSRRSRNLKRSLQFTDILAAAKLHANKYARLSRELRALYFSVAQTNIQAPPPDEDELEIIPGGDEQQRARDDIIADYIPADWELRIGQVPLGGIPACFFKSALEWLLSHDADTDAARAISWLELTIALHRSALSAKPCSFGLTTVASQVKLVKRLYTIAFNYFRAPAIPSPTGHLGRSFSGLCTVHQVRSLQMDIAPAGPRCCGPCPAFQVRRLEIGLMHCCLAVHRLRLDRQVAIYVLFQNVLQ